MNDMEWRRARHLVRWGFIALLIVVGVSIAASLVYLALRGPTPVGPFFPFPWFWGFLWIFFIFWIVRWFFWPWGWRGYGRGPYWHDRDDAYGILRERYARGEITKDQFDQMMRDLREPGQSATR